MEKALSNREPFRSEDLAMRCPSCRKRTPGFPDKCSSCDGPILSAWHGWYRFFLWMGLPASLGGVSLVVGAAERDDLLRFAVGTLILVVGLYEISLGIILRNRNRREAAVLPGIATALQKDS